MFTPRSRVLPDISESLSRVCGTPSVPVFHSHHSCLSQGNLFGRKEKDFPSLCWVLQGHAWLNLKKKNKLQLRKGCKSSLKCAVFCLFALFEQTHPVTTQLFPKASSLSKPIKWLIHLNYNQFKSPSCSSSSNFLSFQYTYKEAKMMPFCSA